MRNNPKVVVAGAGSIGCFVGGLLSIGGWRVTLLARERIASQIADHGLHLTSLEGWSASAEPEVSVDPGVLSNADLVLVTVKSGATEDMSRLIAAHAPVSAAIVSLQNGVTNARRLRSVLAGRRVLAGMVSFNVVSRGDGQFHRGTSGPLIIEAGNEPALEALRAPHLDVRRASDMDAVQWGKLLLNLNNALNALSGLPLREQLLDRRWRRLLAAQQREALGALRDAGIRPWSMGPIPARLFPTMLSLPTPFFQLLARSAVRIDAQARSSMWEDLQRGRRTEIDELQGAVVELAKRHGRAALLNDHVAGLVREAEQRGTGSPQLSPDAIFE